ncbi:hypothetical protein Aperf_G00000025863 [Anoplocephala perfoliata]
MMPSIRPCAECLVSTPRVFCDHCKLRFCRPCYEKHTFDGTEKLRKAESDLNAILNDLTNYQNICASKLKVTNELIKLAEAAISSIFSKARTQIEDSKSQLLERVEDIKSLTEKAQSIIDSKEYIAKFINGENIKIETLKQAKGIFENDLPQIMGKIPPKIRGIEKERTFTVSGEKIVKRYSSHAEYLSCLKSLKNQPFNSRYPRLLSHHADSMKLPLEEVVGSCATYPNLPHLHFQSCITSSFRGLRFAASLNNLRKFASSVYCEKISWKPRTAEIRLLKARELTGNIFTSFNLPP